MQLCNWFHYTKMNFSIKDFLSKCDQIRSFPTIWSYLLKKSLALLAPGGRRRGGGYHRGIILSRTLERQMILNWNFVTFNIFFMVNKVLKKFFGKNLPIVRSDSFVKSLWQHFYVFLLRSKYYWKLCENFFIGKF